MDFIDLETFSAVNSVVDRGSDDALPAPSSVLNLSAYSLGTSQDERKFKIPDVHKQNLDAKDDKENLYDRMAGHAALFMKKLDLNEHETHEANNSAKLTSQFKEPTKASLPGLEIEDFGLNKKSQTSRIADQLLLKKLSRVLNEHALTNYHTRTQIRKSLQSLEDNRERLMLDDEKLIDPGYVGNLARKSMRSDLEGELLKDHLTILEELTPIIKRIKRLSSSVENIKSVGNTIINDSHKTTAGGEKQTFLKHVESLQSDVRSLKLRKRLLCAIKDQFTLSQVEDDIIVNGSVDSQFFDVVAKAMNIKEKATILLALPNSKAGSSLIVKVNSLLEIVNRKVFNHLVDFLYNYESNLNAYSEHTSSSSGHELEIFRNCLIYLSSDLEYFNEFLKRVTSMRTKNALDDFLSQFDYNTKDSRPLLLSAGDPLRYIGDLLANVHSLIANEADFVKSLFKFQSDSIENASFTVPQQNKEFLHGLDRKLLNEIIKSLANPCRIRIEQVVKFEEDPVINLKVFRLLDLYQLMFKKQEIDEDSLLVTELKLIQGFSRNKIESYFVNLKGNITSTNDMSQDLMPPDWFQEYVNKQVEVFEVYDRGRSPESEESPAIDLTNFLENTVLQMIEEVLLKRLQQAFPLAKKNDEARSSLLTAQINSLDLIKSRFQPFTNTIFAFNEETTAVWSAIESKLDNAVNRLLDVQIKLLFDRTGLGLYHNLFNMIFPVTSVQDELDYDMYLSLCENPLMKLETISGKVHKSLNDYAPQALTDIQTALLFRLTSPSIADYICDSCLSKLCHFYVTFRRVLLHLYPDRKEDIVSILNFSEEEFKTLIGIQ